LSAEAVGVAVPPIDNLFSLSVKKWAKMQLGWDLDVDVVDPWSLQRVDVDVDDAEEEGSFTTSLLAEDAAGGGSGGVSHSHSVSGV
jgi:hypothetical protein